MSQRRAASKTVIGPSPSTFNAAKGAGFNHRRGNFSSRVAGRERPPGGGFRRENSLFISP
jgi:hypothetical protein